MIAAFLLFSIALTGIQDNPKAVKPDEKRIRELVQQLGDADFELREEAESELARIGAMARPILEETMKSGDAEQRLRADRLLRALDRESLWEPSRITLSAKDEKVVSLAQAIAKQSNNPIDLSQLPADFAATARVEWKATPYWQAIEELCQLAKLETRHNNAPFERSLLLKPEHFRKPLHSSFFGPVRLRLTGIQRRLFHTIDFAQEQNEREDDWSFSFTMDWEERLPLCRYETHVRIIEASTDAGEELGRPNLKPRALMPVYRRRQEVEFVASKITPPKKSFSKFNRIRALVDVEAVSDYATLSLSAAKPGGRSEQHGFSLEFRSMTSVENNWAIDLQFTRPKAFQRFNSTEMVDEYLEILDADGKLLPFNQQQVIGNEYTVKFVVHVPKAEKEPRTVQFKVGTLRSQKTLEFAFKDVAVNGTSE